MNAFVRMGTGWIYEPRKVNFKLFDTTKTHFLKKAFCFDLMCIKSNQHAISKLNTF